MQSNAVLAILFVCAVSVAHALAADTRPRLTSTLRSRSDISRRLPQLGAAGDAIPLHEQTLTGCPARTAEGSETASPARHQAAQCVSRSWSTVLAPVSSGSAMLWAALPGRRRLATGARRGSAQ